MVWEGGAQASTSLGAPPHVQALRPTVHQGWLPIKVTSITHSTITVSYAGSEPLNGGAQL
jgi:hypothetical protein